MYVSEKSIAGLAHCSFIQFDDLWNHGVQIFRSDALEPRPRLETLSEPWLYPGAEIRSAHHIATPTQAPVWGRQRSEHCWSRGLLPDTSKDDLLIPHARAAAVVSSCLHGLNSQAFLVANDTAYIHSRSYCPTLRVAPTQHSRTRSLSTRVWLCCCKVNGPL